MKKELEKYFWAEIAKELQHKYATPMHPKDWTHNVIKLFLQDQEAYLLTAFEKDTTKAEACGVPYIKGRYATEQWKTIVPTTFIRIFNGESGGNLSSKNQFAIYFGYDSFEDYVNQKTEKHKLILQTPAKQEAEETAIVDITEIQEQTTVLQSARPSFPSLWLKWIFRNYYYKQALKFINFEGVDIEKDLLWYIPSQLQRKNAKPGANSKTIGSFIQFFLKKIRNRGQNKFYFILGGLGMGKTTNLVNLFLAYQERKAIHFFEGKYDMHLLSLSDQSTFNKIKNIKDPTNAILLLDGFDEDEVARLDWQKRLNELVSICKDFYLIIVSGRSQFFVSTEAEPSLTDIPNLSGTTGSKKYTFERYFITFFDQLTVEKYLRKRFPYREYQLLSKRIAHFQDIKYRPFILSNIDYLDRRHYDYEFEIFQNIEQNWLLRENISKEEIKQVQKFSKSIAYDIYLNQAKRGGSFIDLATIEGYAADNNITLSSLDLRSKTFLYRYGDKFGFAHQSIWQYFLALNLLERVDLEQGFDFKNRGLTDQFLQEMLWKELVDQWWPDLNGYYQLKDADDVQSLHFNHTRLSRTDTPQVSCLNLANNHLKSLNVIRLFRNVENLDLKENQIKDLAPLKVLQRLKVLDLRGNLIEDNQMDTLQFIIEQNPIHTLLLDKNLLNPSNQMKLQEQVLKKSGTIHAA